MTLPLIRMTLADYVAAGCDTERATVNICNRDGIACVQPGETLPAALRRLHGEQEISPDELEIVCPDDVPKVIRGVSEYDAGDYTGAWDQRPDAGQVERFRVVRVPDYTGAWDQRPDASRKAVELVLPTVAEWRAYPKEADQFAVDATYWPDYDEAAWRARDAEACASDDPDTLTMAATFAAHAPEMPRWFAKERGCYDDRGERRIGPQADELWFRTGCEWRWYFANQMLSARKAGAA